MSEEKASYTPHDMYQCGFLLATKKEIKALPETEIQAEEWYKGFLAGMHENNSQGTEVKINVHLLACG